MMNADDAHDDNDKGGMDPVLSPIWDPIWDTERGGTVMVRDTKTRRRHA